MKMWALCQESDSSACVGWFRVTLGHLTLHPTGTSLFCADCLPIHFNCDVKTSNVSFLIFLYKAVQGHSSLKKNTWELPALQVEDTIAGMSLVYYADFTPGLHQHFRHTSMSRALRSQCCWSRVHIHHTCLSLSHLNLRIHQQSQQAWNSKETISYTKIYKAEEWFDFKPICLVLQHSPTSPSFPLAKIGHPLGAAVGVFMGDCV